MHIYMKMDCTVWNAYISRMTRPNWMRFLALSLSSVRLNKNRKIFLIYNINIEFEIFGVTKRRKAYIQPSAKPKAECKRSASPEWCTHGSRKDLLDVVGL